MKLLFSLIAMAFLFSHCGNDYEAPTKNSDPQVPCRLEKPGCSK